MLPDTTKFTDTDQPIRRNPLSPERQKQILDGAITNARRILEEQGYVVMYRPFACTCSRRFANRFHLEAHLKYANMRWSIERDASQEAHKELIR